MADFKTPTSSENCAISVVTEALAGGGWAAVATVTHTTEGAVNAIPVPLPHQTFLTELEARHFAIQAAEQWIDQNTPKLTGLQPAEQSAGEDPDRTKRSTPLSDKKR